MATREEVVLAVLGAVAAVLYFTVAWVQSRRKVSGDARSALRGFIMFWVGLGALGLITLFFTFGPDLAEYGLNGVRAVIYILFAGIFVFFGGLVYYLMYLYTGNSQSRWYVAAFYALVLVFLVWLIEAHAPHVGDPFEHMDPTCDDAPCFHLHDQPADWTGPVLSLGLVLPPLAAAIAYALLFFRTNDRTAKYRIAMVSTGFVLWFLYSTLGALARLATGADQSFEARLTGQVLGVIAATLTLLAYEPPRWIRERLRIRDITETLEPAPEPKPRVAAV